VIEAQLVLAEHHVRQVGQTHLALIPTKSQCYDHDVNKF
jgi:hypothetical protein